MTSRFVDFTAVLRVYNVEILGSGGETRGDSTVYVKGNDNNIGKVILLWIKVL